jgi:hypothetical protein
LNIPSDFGYLPKIYKTYISAIVVFAFCLTARADTALPDTLHHITHLTAAGSPYIIDSQTLILEGDTLEVDAGVEIKFLSHYETDPEGGPDILRIPVVNAYGYIKFSGTEDSLITLVNHEDSEVEYWFGIRVIEFDQEAYAEFNFVQFENANVGVQFYLSERVGEDIYSGLVKNCIFKDSGISMIVGGTANYQIQNCIFDNSAGIDVASYVNTFDLRNSIFLPSDNATKIGLRLFGAIEYPEDGIQYNCFHGAGGQFTTFIQHWVSNDSIITVEPDFTSLISDPGFVSDDSYYLDPVSSPLIDAGDPAIIDPDGSRSDIGVFWVPRLTTPFTFDPSFDADEWVSGFDYQGRVGITGYPLPEFEILEMPSGMYLQQNSSVYIDLLWPAEAQVPGDYPIRIVGSNTIQSVVYSDTLNVSLALMENRIPTISVFQPCPSDLGDCQAEREIIIDYLLPSNDLEVHLEISDPDSIILGDSQQKYFRIWRNGINTYSSIDSVLTPDELNFSERLDTTYVEYWIGWSDGQLSDSLNLKIQPVYSLLAGDIEGVLSPEDGAIYFTGNTRIPFASSLNILPGTTLIANASLGEGVDWFLDVEGELDIQGDVDNPVIFYSGILQNQLDSLHAQAQFWPDIEDVRPGLIRISGESSTISIRNTVFEGFGDVIRIEYLNPQNPVVIENCDFIDCRIALLAVGTPVEISNCRFHAPEDWRLRSFWPSIGSYGIYLAESSGNIIRNNLFLNPIIGIQLVDVFAEISNNSFHSIANENGFFQSWLAGFSRINSINSTVSVVNNLFYWRTSNISNNEDFILSTSQHALWLEESSNVEMRYNWYDCVGCITQLSDLTRALAVNDSTLLMENLENQNGDPRVDNDSDFRLFEDSPLINAGDPGSQWFDAFDNSRADIGWHGGPGSLDGDYSIDPELVEEEYPEILPQSTILHQPWPNPFNPQTNLRIDLLSSGHVSLSVYNILGQNVSQLIDGQLDAGVYHITFEAGTLATGTYFARLETAGQTSTVKMMLIK